MSSDSMVKLWTQLPEEIEERNTIFTLEMHKYDGITSICYRNFDGDARPEDGIEDEDPIIAMENMLIYIRAQNELRLWNS